MSPRILAQPYAKSSACNDTYTLRISNHQILKISSILVHEAERRQYSRKEYHTWLSYHSVMSLVSYLLSDSLRCCAWTVEEVETGLSDGRCVCCLGNVLLCFGLMMSGNVVLGCFGIGRLGFWSPQSVIFKLADALCPK